MGSKCRIIAISFEVPQYLKVEGAVWDGSRPIRFKVSFIFSWRIVSVLARFSVLSDVVNVIGESALDICENIVGARVNDDNSELLNF